MPHSNLHKRKKWRNYAILIAIIAWVGLIWAVAMVKMGQGW